VSVALLPLQVQMPPAPGRSVGCPLQITVDPALYAAPLAAMPALAMAAVTRFRPLARYRCC